MNMKKINYTLSFVFLLLAVNISMAQVARTSWSFGFGLDYPTFFSTDLRVDNVNFGGYLSIQRNFFDNVALRFTGAFDRMEGDMPSTNYFYSSGARVPRWTRLHTNVLAGNLDLLYYFTPCLWVSPYIGLGPGLIYYKPDWGTIVNVNAVSKASIQLNAVFGSEWKLSPAWYLKTEIALHSTTGQLDGIIDNTRKGILNSDADGYVVLSAGLQYYFWKGEPSKYCEIYSGIKPIINRTGTPPPTIEDIDNVIKNHVPQIVEKKIEVDTCCFGVGAANKNWVLFGVNFERNKYTLSPEAYPVLINSVEILKENPGTKVEIQGYTDNTERSQKALSEKRAAFVKDYLVKRGIESSRITTAGYSSQNPIGDNGTEAGRARNRRIEFKVVQ
jgi:hypothetical protein